MEDLAVSDRVANALFQSVTLRTAGFNSVGFEELQPATLWMMLVWMFVGASPGGTGGGIKTTTAVVLFGAVLAILARRDRLRELHLDAISCAVVAIGADSIEASILATILLRQIGVPQIVARSVNSLHGRALRAVGAHVVVRPEQEMGDRLALRLAQPSVLERIELGPDAELAEFPVPSDSFERSLVDLKVRRRHGVTVVAIRRGDRVLATLDGSEKMVAGDILVVIGTPEAVAKLAARA